MSRTTPFCYVIEDPHTPNKSVSINKDYLGLPQSIQSRDSKGILRLTVIRYIPCTDEMHRNDFHDCVTNVMADYDAFKNFAVNREGEFIQRINYNHKGK